MVRRSPRRPRSSWRCTTVRTTRSGRTSTTTTRTPADMAGWDVHTHLIPPTVLSAAHRGEFGLSVDSGSLVVDGQRLPLCRLADPAALLQWITEQSLDGAVVSVPPALFRYGAGVEWSELVNQGLRELATPQLRVLAHLPLLDSAAPAVAAGLAGEGVFGGFALGTP